MKVTRDDLLSRARSTYAECLELLASKNQDYAQSDDALRNLEACRIVGVSPASAVLARVAEKLARIANLASTSASPLNESFDDSIVDAINYLAILRCLLSSGGASARSGRAEQEQPR